MLQWVLTFLIKFLLRDTQTYSEKELWEKRFWLVGYRLQPVRLQLMVTTYFSAKLHEVSVWQ